MMDEVRFSALAEAFGGRIERWPEDQREAAWRFVAERGGSAQAVLADALALDETLEVLRPPQPSSALRDAILAAAPRSAGLRGRPERSALWRWLTGAGLGAGLAAACAAGIVAGVQSVRPSDEARADALIASGDDGGAIVADAEGSS